MIKETLYCDICGRNIKETLETKDEEINSFDIKLSKSEVAIYDEVCIICATNIYDFIEEKLKSKHQIKSLT